MGCRLWIAFFFLSCCFAGWVGGLGVLVVGWDEKIGNEKGEGGCACSVYIECEKKGGMLVIDVVV